MAHLMPLPKMRFDDSNGEPLAGGKLYSYAAGTSTLQATYTDQGGLTTNANPVILDANGEASVWMGTSPYKFVLKTSADVTLWTVDNVEHVSDLEITTSKINNSAVTTVKIADLNVTTAKINDLAVTTAKLAASAVETAKIADLNVTTAKIAELGVTTAKIANDNVTTGKIADSGVTTVKVATGAITNAKLANSITVLSSGSNTATHNTGTATEVTNLRALSVACTGTRLVHVQLQPYGGTSASYLECTGNGTIWFYRNSTEIARFDMGAVKIPTSLSYYDAPSAGNHDYKVFLETSGGATITIENARLRATEV